MATQRARQMVTQFGMSESLGPRTFGSGQGAIFLGRELGEQRDYSEQAAEEIDNEVHRILKPGGEFHIVDFGRPHGPVGWLFSPGMRHLEETKENFDGKLPGMLRDAGFQDVTETAAMTTIFGPISLLRAMNT